MTRDELQKGIRESFSLVYKKMLFWKYIWHLEKRIAEIEAMSVDEFALLKRQEAEK